MLGPFVNGFALYESGGHNPIFLKILFWLGAVLIWLSFHLSHDPSADERKEERKRERAEKRVVKKQRR